MQYVNTPSPSPLYVVRTINIRGKIVKYVEFLGNNKILYVFVCISQVVMDKYRLLGGTLFPCPPPLIRRVIYTLLEETLTFHS